MSSDDDGSDGFREDQARFRIALDFAAYFGSYGFCCAFTGEDLRPLIDADPRTALLYLTLSQDLRADLILPACREAQDAYQRRQIVVGSTYDLLVSIRHCPKALRDRLSSSGLRLPSSAAFYPNRLVLAEHARDLLSGFDLS